MAGRNEPQQPAHNLSGVLQLAVQNTIPGDDVVPREEMSEERKDFLRNVFKDLYCDEAKEMKKALDAIEPLLGSAEENDSTVKAQLLEHIQDICQTIDNASDFHKVDGTKILRQLLSDPNSEVRWQAAELVAVVSQNNPYSQTVLLNHEFMPVLLGLMEDDEVDLVKIKAIYALSCMVRDHIESSQAFVALDGFSYLIRAMQGNISKLRIKASFLLNALLTMDPKHKDIVQNMGIVELLVVMLQAQHDNTHEFILFLLLTLVQDHPAAQTDARNASLHELLKQRSQLLKGKEEFQEELEYTTELLQIVFSDVNKHVDR